MQELRKKLDTAKTRAYSLKTKKAKSKAWNVVREIEREILSILYAEIARFDVHSIQGTVLTFNPGNDVFLVETEAYGKMWVSPTGDVLSKSWYGHTCCIEYKIGQRIVIECKIEVNHDTLRLNVIPGEMIGGFVNEAQYAELDKRNDLAFFRHSNATGMTGLFAQPKVAQNDTN